MTTHTASWADTVAEADRKPAIPCTRCGAFALDYCVNANGKPLRQIHAARAAEVAAYRAKNDAYQLADASLSDAQRDARDANAQDAIARRTPAPTATSEQQELLAALATTVGISVGNLDRLTVNRAAALIDGLKAALIAR